MLDHLDFLALGTTTNMNGDISPRFRTKSIEMDLLETIQE